MIAQRLNAEIAIDAKGDAEPERERDDDIGANRFSVRPLSARGWGSTATSASYMRSSSQAVTLA